MFCFIFLIQNDRSPTVQRSIVQFQRKIELLNLRYVIKILDLNLNYSCKLIVSPALFMNLYRLISLCFIF
jgi:hypothetical protein